MERQRKEREQQLLREKLDREKKRKEALQEAIQLAEKQAKQEKLRQRHYQHNMNVKENLVEKDCKSPRILLNDEVKPDISSLDLKMVNDGMTKPKPEKNEMMRNRNMENKYKSNIKVLNYDNENNANSRENLGSENAESDPNVPPLQLAQPNPQNVQHENLALVLQTPLETLQNMQFAVLVPSNNNGVSTTFPIAIPLTVATDRSVSRTENRLLTPTVYRNRTLCDSSTQTDANQVKNEDADTNRDKFPREKLAMDVNYDGRNRKEARRARNEDRSRENPEERPKWGVNRPPTRYMKQSEKDPLYQRRKMRQKLRQVKTYNRKSNNYSPRSSDDSQPTSPRPYRKNSYSDQRNVRSLWRKNDQVFSHDVKLYQTEIVPLESDKDQIYYKEACCHRCCCRCGDGKCKYSENFKVVDILKIKRNSPRSNAVYKNGRYKNQQPDSLNNNSIDSSSDICERVNGVHINEE